MSSFILTPKLLLSILSFLFSTKSSFLAWSFLFSGISLFSSVIFSLISLLFISSGFSLFFSFSGISLIFIVTLLKETQSLKAPSANVSRLLGKLIVFKFLHEAKAFLMGLAVRENSEVFC